MFGPFPMVGPICRESMEVHDFIPDLPVSYLLGTKLPVGNVWRNDWPLVPNTKGTGRWGSLICMWKNTFIHRGFIGNISRTRFILVSWCSNRATKSTPYLLPGFNLPGSKEEMSCNSWFLQVSFFELIFTSRGSDLEGSMVFILFCFQHWGSESLKCNTFFHRVSQCFTWCFGLHHEIFWDIRRPRDDQTVGFLNYIFRSRRWLSWKCVISIANLRIFEWDMFFMFVLFKTRIGWGEG